MDPGKRRSEAYWPMKIRLLKQPALFSLILPGDLPTSSERRDPMTRAEMGELRVFNTSSYRHGGYLQRLP